MIGLIQNIAYLPELYGNLLTVARHPAGLFHQPAHRIFIYGQQIVLLPDLAGDHRKFQDLLFTEIHDRVKFSLHLEEFLEILIPGMQQEIKPGGTDQNDLHIQGYGIGLQAFCANESIALPNILDCKFGIVKRPFKAVPGKIIEQKFLHRQNEVSSISPVKGTAPD